MSTPAASPEIVKTRTATNPGGIDPARSGGDRSPLRILHVIGGIDPNLGGPATMLISLAAAQARAGHAVTILSYRQGGNEERLAKTAALVPGFDRVRVEFLPPMTAGERYFAWHAKAWARKHAGMFDVVHTHGVWESVLTAAADAARAADVPYVVTPHGMLDHWALSRKAWKKRLGLRLGKGAFVRGAGAAHVLSIHERDCVVQGGFHARAEIIPNGVFLEQVDPLPAPGAFRATRPEIGSDPYVFFLARLHPEKGLDLLVEAFARLRGELPALRVVIAGPDFGAEAALRAQIARLGVQDRVHLIGPLWDRSKFAALVDAACFCLPSAHEGFSMSIAEALACGTPVVITDLCHFPEVREVGAGEVVERTVEALTEGLRRVLTHPEARAAYGQAGRGLIEQRFTWPRIAERTVALYRALAGAGSGKAGPA